MHVKECILKSCNSIVDGIINFTAICLVIPQNKTRLYPSLELASQSYQWILQSIPQVTPLNAGELKV